MTKKAELVSTAPTVNVESLLMKAVESGQSIDTLERLLAMREKLQSEFARTEYFKALSEFQSECPFIPKERTVKDKSGNVRYKYASLDDIVKVVGPLLKTHGLSFTVNTDNTAASVAAICEIHHAAGHSEKSVFVVPVEETAFMNEAQKVASAQAYAKRYAFCNALGILTSDMDDDGQSLGQGVTIQDIYKRMQLTMSKVFEHYETIQTIKYAIKDKTLDIAIEAWEELSNADKMALWVAPTKGGPFTTEERKAMHSDEWHHMFKSIYGEKVEPIK